MAAAQTADRAEIPPDRNCPADHSPGRWKLFSAHLRVYRHCWQCSPECREWSMRLHAPGEIPSIVSSTAQIPERSRRGAGAAFVSLPLRLLRRSGLRAQTTSQIAIENPTLAIGARMGHPEKRAIPRTGFRFRFRILKSSRLPSAHRGVPPDQGLAVGQDDFHQLADRGAVLGGPHSHRDLIPGFKMCLVQPRLVMSMGLLTSAAQCATSPLSFVASNLRKQCGLAHSHSVTVAFRTNCFSMS